MATRRLARLAASRAAARAGALASPAAVAAPPVLLAPARSRLAAPRGVASALAMRAAVARVAAPWRSLHVCASAAVRAPDDLPSAPPGAVPAEEAVRKEFAHMTGSDTRAETPLPPIDADLSPVAPDAEKELPNPDNPTGVDVMRSRLPGASGGAEWRLDAERRGSETRINADPHQQSASPTETTADDSAAEPQWGASAVGYGEMRPGDESSSQGIGAKASSAEASSEQMSDWQPVLEEEATVATAAPFDRFDVAPPGSEAADDVFHQPAAAHAAYEGATAEVAERTAASAEAATEAAAAPDAASAFVAGAVPGASAGRAAREDADAIAFDAAEDMARRMKNAAFGGRDQAAEAEGAEYDERSDAGPVESEAEGSAAVAAAEQRAASASAPGVANKLKRAARKAASTAAHVGHDAAEVAAAMRDDIACELGAASDKDKDTKTGGGKDDKRSGSDAARG